MKITGQTADQMLLKDDGGFLGMALGALFVVVGLYFGWSSYASVGFTKTLWIFIIFVVVGLVAMLFSSNTTVVITKSTGLINYRKKGLIGSRSAGYNIADVARVETRKQWQTQSSGTGRNAVSRPVLMASSFLVFKDGQELQLDSPKGSSGMVIGPITSMSSQSGESALANQIATFLGVPFQEVAPPGPGFGINTGSGNIQL